MSPGVVTVDALWCPDRSADLAGVLAFMHDEMADDRCEVGVQCPSCGAEWVFTFRGAHRHRRN